MKDCPGHPGAWTSALERHSPGHRCPSKTLPRSKSAVPSAWPDWIFDPETGGLVQWRCVEPSCVFPPKQHHDAARRLQPPICISAVVSIQVHPALRSRNHICSPASNSVPSTRSFSERNTMAARSRGLGITSKDMVGTIQISVSWYCWCVVLAHKGLLCRTGGLPAGVCLREGLKTTQVSFITKAAPQAQHLPVLPPLMPDHLGSACCLQESGHPCARQLHVGPVFRTGDVIGACSRWCHEQLCWHGSTSPRGRCRSRPS